MEMLVTTSHFASSGANPDIRLMPMQVTKSGGKTPKYEIANEAAAMLVAPAKPKIKMRNKRRPAGK